jgi:hypothetical protein
MSRWNPLAMMVLSLIVGIYLSRVARDPEGTPGGRFLIELLKIGFSTRWEFAA